MDITYRLRKNKEKKLGEREIVKKKKKKFFFLIFIFFYNFLFRIIFILILYYILFFIIKITENKNTKNIFMKFIFFNFY